MIIIQPEVQLYTGTPTLASATYRDYLSFMHYRCGSKHDKYFSFLNELKGTRYINTVKLYYTKKKDTDYSFKMKLNKALLKHQIQFTPCKINKLIQEAKKKGFIYI